jgi:hypothetical protein
MTKPGSVNKFLSARNITVSRVICVVLICIYHWAVRLRLWNDLVHWEWKLFALAFIFLFFNVFELSTILKKRTG